ncbi:MAG: VWA domain-containing protein [Phycisphaerales bacterium]
MRFESIQWLLGLWVVAALLAIAVVMLLRQRSRLERFATPELLAIIGRGLSTPRRLIRVCLMVGALTLIVIGLARPQWNAEPRTERLMGRDVCFVVDVSRSMLAEDLKPNRLERAKLWIEDVLESAHGDRVGLVAFAGTAVVKCPLTQDRGFMRMALEDLGTNSVSRGGTLIGDAIRVTLNDVFDLDEARHRDIILITDGEDHESFPIEAGVAAGQADVRIIAIGVGDESEGARIPDPDRPGRYVTHQGETVRTRLDAGTLRELALSSKDGKYLNVATGTVELDNVYKRLVRDAEQNEIKARDVIRYEEKFQIFLAVAFALLTIEGFMHERRKT